MIACKHGHFEIVNCLLKHGAALPLEDIEGKTARDHAIDALEAELEKSSTDIKVKTKIAEL
jgi:ankyrin repeat protein